MVKLISYPFRFHNGVLVTTEDGMDYYAEELAMLIKTHPGERELVPDYGIEDPTFNNLNRSELLEKISLFGPPVEIESSTSQFLPNGRIAINLSYSEIPIGYSDDFEEDDDYDELEDDDLFDESDQYGFIDATDF